MSRLSAFTKRWGWLFAVFGGLSYLMLNVAIESRFPDHWAGSPARLAGLSYAGVSRLLWIPSVLLLLAVTGIYAHVSRSVGRLGKIGFTLAAAGLALELVGGILEFWLFGYLLVPFLGAFRTGSAGSQLGYEVASYGTFILIFGLLLFGVACLRAPLPLRWRLSPFFIGLIYATILLFFFADRLAIHALVYGLCWIALGYLMWKDEWN